MHFGLSEKISSLRVAHSYTLGLAGCLHSWASGLPLAITPLPLTRPRIAELTPSSPRVDFL